MAVVTKINGKVVSQQELDAWHERRVDLFGKDWFDPAKWERRSLPKIRTGKTFNRGKATAHHGFDKDTWAIVKRKARRAGVSLEGKTYYGQLARGSCDLRAFCSDESEVMKLAEIRARELGDVLNVHMPDGTVRKFGQPAKPVEKPKKYEVAEDIVDRYATYRSLDNPGLATNEKEYLDLKEVIREEITPEWIDPRHEHTDNPKSLMERAASMGAAVGASAGE